MLKPTEAELSLLRLLADERCRLDHEDPRLEVFCDDDARPFDVFNACSEKGWTRNTHDYLTGASTVHLTDIGKARIWDADHPTHAKEI